MIMTAVGKIMAFLVLVLSIGVFGMSIFVHSLWSDLRGEFDKLKKNYDVLQASRSAYEEESKERKVQSDRVKNEAKAKDDRIAKLTTDLNGAQTTIVTLNSSAANQQAQFKQTLEQAKAENDARQKQFDEIRGTLEKEQTANVSLAKERDDMRQREVAAQIEAKNLRDRFGQMEKQLREMTKQMDNSKSTTIVGAGRPGAGRDRNPPMDNVEGEVKSTDATGLLRLSIGSDQGLQRGHTLELFRLNLQNPGQSKYLGSIRVLEVSNHEAVGEPVRALADRAKVGDRVASRILGDR
jgi:hypothetical protein